MRLKYKNKVKMKFEALPNRHSELTKISVDIELSNLALSVVIYDFTLLTCVTLRGSIHESPFFENRFW